MFQILQGLSYKACSAMLPKLFAFGLSILVFVFRHYTPAVYCYVTRTYEIRLQGTRAQSSTTVKFEIVHQCRNIFYYSNSTKTMIYLPFTFFKPKAL